MDDALKETIERDKIYGQIERAAQTQGLEGKRRESFVDSPSLCTTCSSAMITRRASRNNRVIQCGALKMQVVPEDITECSRYTSLTEMSLYEMAEIAVIIDVTKQKRVGFNI